ncbi:MAG: hypothetical protein AB7V18_19115 [Pyrinomonadaceae bacterium]
MDRWTRWKYRLHDEGDAGGAGGDPPKPPPPPRAIPVEILPEELRDRPDAEIQFLLGHMVNALGERNNEVDTLKDQIAELRGEVRTPKAPPAPDPDAEKSDEELILENVEKTLDRYLERKGYVKTVQGLGSEVGETMISLMSQEIDDFEEHEATIREILKRGKLPATRDNILGAYTMAVGEKHFAEKKKGGRGSKSIPPSAPPAPTPPVDEPKLSTLETEVMRAHGITDPKVWAQYRDNPPALKLPTGAKR